MRERPGLRANLKRSEFVVTLWVTCSKPQRNLRGPRRDLGEGKTWRIRADPEPKLNPDISSGFHVFALVFSHLPLEKQETSKGP